jgi:phage tail tube protein FII
MQAGIINFAVYEDGVEYLGIANVKLPDWSNKKLTVNGAGIPGDVDIPIPGHFDAATMSISFTDANKAAYQLTEQRRHTIDIRVAHEEYDATAGKIVIKSHKHVLEVMPLKIGGNGTIAPSAAQAASGDYTVFSQADYIDGVMMGKHDVLNYRDIDSSGTDRLAAVRSALGKS